jgi:hypothetical protein
VNRFSKSQKLRCGLLVFIALFISSGAWAQDTGFDILYEGVVDSEPDKAESKLDLLLYGVAGFNPGGTFWATGGARAAFALDGLALNVDASYGTSGFQIIAGGETEIGGFGVGGDVSWAPGGPAIIDLRGWGTVDVFRLSANVLLGGTNTAVTLSGSTDFEGFGLSANLGLSAGGLTQAAVGANMALGGLSISGSAGISGGQVNVGGGASLQVGPLSLIANAGYDGAIGMNAIVGGTLGWSAFEASVIGLLDNTGVGAEVSSELTLGPTTMMFTGRFSVGGLSVEVGVRIPLGGAVTSVSVAFDDQSGFSWAEAGFELPLR